MPSSGRLNPMPIAMTAPKIHMTAARMAMRPATGSTGAEPKRTSSIPKANSLTAASTVCHVGRTPAIAVSGDMILTKTKIRPSTLAATTARRRRR